MSGACHLCECPAADGIDLRFRDYRPDRPQSWAILLIHGLAEHGGRYDHVARICMNQGIRVVVPDLRGHGRSGGVRTDVHSFNEYVEDIRYIRAAAGLDPKRLLVLGHSMGGLVAIRYAEIHPTELACLVALAPLLRVAQPISPFRYALGMLCSLVAPTTRFQTRIRTRNMAGSQTFLDRRRADPLLQKNVTARWYFRMISAIRKAHRDVARLTVPILILQGTEDQTVVPEAAYEWAASLPHLDHETISIPGGLHELLNDGEWQDVLTQLLTWARMKLVPAARIQPLFPHSRKTPA